MERHEVGEKPAGGVCGRVERGQAILEAGEKVEDVEVILAVKGSFEHDDTSSTRPASQDTQSIKENNLVMTLFKYELLTPRTHWYQNQALGGTSRPS